MPWGEIAIVFNDNKLIEYVSLSGDLPSIKAKEATWLELSLKLQKYANGEPVEFFEQLKTNHLPDFTRNVLLWLQHNCRYGETVTYGDIARAVGKPKSARAVGQVMSKNQLPLFVP